MMHSRTHGPIYCYKCSPDGETLVLDRVILTRKRGTPTWDKRAIEYRPTETEALVAMVTQEAKHPAVTFRKHTQKGPVT